MQTNKEVHTHTHTGYSLDIPIFTKLYDFYKKLSQALELFPKSKKYTLGQKIDNIALSLFELVVSAGNSEREKKLPVIEKAIIKLDLLKILIRLAYDTKIYNHRKYLELEEALQEIGRMLGGWKKSLKQF